MKFYCEDLEVLRRRLKDLDRDIQTKLDDHEVGTLLTTIDGIGQPRRPAWSPSSEIRLVSAAQARSPRTSAPCPA